MNPTTHQAPSGKIIRTGDNGFISVVMNGEQLNLRAYESADRFNAALEAIKAEDWDALYDAMRPAKSFLKKIGGVTIDNGQVMWNGMPLANAIATRIMDFINEGLPHEPLCHFMDKLMANPSKRAVDELYTFLEHKNMPITDNGNFLAYKGIQDDWYSITASQVDGKKLLNKVGMVVEMPRNQVCDDKNQGCSYGLHAGTVEYATQFGRGGRVVIVEINPADVVSIPTDCSFQKLRTSKYKVVGEYQMPLTSAVAYSNWRDDDAAQYDNDEDRPESHEFQCSSFLDSAEWYSDNSVLVRFQNGEQACHENVTKTTWFEWIAQEDKNKSAGRYYNWYIKE